MTNNNFEKRIQDKLNQYEIEPSENLFDDILEKRASRPKSILKFTYAKLGVALLAVAAITLFILVDPGSNSTSNDNASIAVSEKDANNSTNIAEAGGLESNATTAKAESVRETVVAKERLKTVKQKSTSKVTKPIDNKKDVSNTEVKWTNNAPLPSRKSVIANASKSSQKSARQTKTYPGYQDNGENIAERYFNVDAKNRPILAGQQHQGKSHLYVYHSMDENLINAQDLSYLVLKPLRVIKPSAFQDQIAAVEKKQIETNHKKQQPFYLDLYYSAYHTGHSVIGKSEYANNYKALAKSNPNHAFNLRISTPINSHINLFTGFGLNQINTKFDGQIANTTNKVHYETSTYYINDPITGLPKLVQQIDTVLNGPVSYNFANHYTLMQIPIGLSYNFGFDKMDIGIHGSALMNITSKANGMNPDFNLEKMKSFSSNQKQVGFGASLSLMFAYKLTNKIKIIAEPSIQFYQLGGKKIGSAMNENILNKGLSVGLRYTLF
jgi:hypothetical protein